MLSNFIKSLLACFSIIDENIKSHDYRPVGYRLPIAVANRINDYVIYLLQTAKFDDVLASNQCDFLKSA